MHVLPKQINAYDTYAQQHRCFIMLYTMYRDVQAMSIENFPILSHCTKPLTFQITPHYAA